MKRTLGVLALVLMLWTAWMCLGQEAVNFGAVAVGTLKSATYTLRNSNPFNCTIEAVGFGEDYAQSSGAFLVSGLELPVPIESGASVAWTVQFRPTAIATYQSEMKIRLRCGIFTQNLAVPVTGQGGTASADAASDATTPPSDTDCGCSPQISAVTAQVNGLTALVQMQLAPALQQIQAQLLQLESPAAQGDADSFCPGPFPSSGGQRFLDFLTAQRSLAVQAAIDLPQIQSDDPAQQALLAAGAAYLGDLTTDLDAITQQLLTLAPEYLPCFDSYVPTGMTDYLDAAIAVASDASTHPKLAVLFESSGMDVAQTVWDKIKIWAGHIPLVGGIIQSAMEDIDALTESGADALGVASMMFQYEMERKLDGIIYGLFGIEIPANATEAQLMDLLRRISGDSVTARLERLEEDAARQAQALDDLGAQVEAVGDTAQEALDVARDNQREIAVLEDKVCCFIWAMNRFGQELGDALYGDRETFSNMIPAVCEATTYAQCYAGSHETGVFPPEDEARDAIKPEIRSLEADMQIVRETLEEILRRLGDDLIPIDETPPVVPPFTPDFPVTESSDDHTLLLVTKKIYVYAEDTFMATASSDVRDVVVTTPAFDVSGWIDATQLRSGDQLTVELTIRIDGQERTWLTSTFAGGTDSRLVYFDELSGGRTFIVGSWIRIRITQTRSADGYATLVPIGYQFIVQSQR